MLKSIALAALVTVAAIAPANAVTVVGATKVVVTNAIPTWLQVAELQAFDFSSTNVALQANGGVASASSVYQNGAATPDQANDGVFPADYPNIFHSGSPNAGEFLQIDFSGPATLSSLTIYGRNGCCQDRDLFNISIYNANGDTLFSGQLDARNGGPASVTFDAPVGVPETATWALMIAGFGMTGLSLRRRKIALTA